jgi:uncharacterized glyoxalase superfamily metalloenzyme YdcJ
MSGGYIYVLGNTVRSIRHHPCAIFIMSSMPTVATQDTCTPGYIFSSQDELRSAFALSMSAMYKAEVPLYGDLVALTASINKQILEAKHQTPDAVHWPDESTRLDLERHGAVRVGTPQELATMRRLFALIGLHPIGYYDLSVAGLPMHATAFRPLTPEALAINPFRVFTTLLRPELLAPSARELAMSLLSRRSIFSSALMELIDIGETQHGLTPEQGTAFVAEAMKTFMWQPVTTTSYDDYLALKEEHPIIADVACFGSAHINHLTPRTLDIDMAHSQMKAQGLAVKSRIEGPPLRSIPILLRQTSFLALEEKIKFLSTTDSQVIAPSLVEGSHRARFGEIEQRGTAVTPRGRRLYDRLLSRATQESCRTQATSAETDEILRRVFQGFPDDWATLLEQRLVYCTYSVNDDRDIRARHIQGSCYVNKLLETGVLRASPQTYEDFLPFSAAGIFHSNLGQAPSDGDTQLASEGDQAGFERALGASVLDADVLYQVAEIASLVACSRKLGIECLVPESCSEYDP